MSHRSTISLICQFRSSTIPHICSINPLQEIPFELPGLVYFLQKIIFIGKTMHLCSFLRLKISSLTNQSIIV